MTSAELDAALVAMALPWMRVAVVDIATVAAAEVALVDAAGPELGAWLATVGVDRRRSFLAGRVAAAAALEAGGAAPQGRRPRFLPRRGSGAPEWPDGWCGSISHGDGVAIAVVAPLDACDGVGVDVEATRVFDPDLRALVRREDAPGLHDTAVFASKEAVYKALARQDPGWLDFHDVAVRSTEATAGVHRISVRARRGQAMRLPCERLRGHCVDVGRRTVSLVWLEPRRRISVVW